MGKVVHARGERSRHASRACRQRRGRESCRQIDRPGRLFGVTHRPAARIGKTRQSLRRGEFTTSERRV